METASGSGSLTDSANSNPPSPPTESVNGLKFGKKIYFEDLGMGAPHKSSAPSRPPPQGSGAPIRKGPGGQQHQQQPPRCQVEGCNVDLSDAKAYYSRHKVCGMHSKFPHVLVAGLQQRFCQQCSRFHQLPEFDQGKRSCRRRLAGHNARRRKQPPGSVLSSRYGRFSSTIFDNSSRVGGFLVDFSAYPRHTGRDAWPGARSSEQVTGNQVTPTARSVPHPWQNSLQNPPSNLYLQASASETGFPGPGITPGECFTGVGINTDSSCALSLLSNQPWDSRMNELVNAGAPVPQSTVPRSAADNHYPNWGLKDHEAGSSSHQMHPDLGLGQIPQPLSDQFARELELSQQSTRQYMELEHSRSYDSSTPHINWLL